MIWSYLDTGARPGAANMMIDEALALRLKEGIGLPTLRIYRWRPFAVSLGYHEPAEDFDAGRLRDAGVDLVRRPTGGRAIFHADELTYSVVMPLDDRGPRGLYHFINGGLLAGVRLLGIDAVLASASDDLRTSGVGPSSVPCFATSAKSEVQVQGRKLIGSAQRRYGGVILQHGSLLLGPEHRKITGFLSAGAGNAREEIERHLEHHTIDARTALGRPVAFDEAARFIRLGFETACGIEFVESTFADDADPGFVSSLTMN